MTDKAICSNPAFPMHREYPFLRATKPDGARYTIDIESIIDRQSKEICIYIGRQSNNDIVLSDPQKRVSKHHCSIQYQNNRWWIVDKGSSNGTFLQREIDQTEIDVRSEDRVVLRSGDHISILGELDTSGQPIFWQLEFIDPGETNQIIGMRGRVYSIEYSLSQQSLYRNLAHRRHSVSLSGQERALIDYMSRKNRQNGDRPTLCEYDELIRAVWKDEHFGITRQRVNGLVCRIRDRIELDSGGPEFLRTVTGIGYIINIKVVE